MNLPTPPTTSHREEKENRAVDAGARNVAWSKQNQFHSLSTPAKGPSCSSARRMLPAKSILKPSQPLLPLPDLKTREETPAPSTPLNDFQYLQHPISHIVSPDSTITDLIRAYSALTARIRPYVTEETDSTVPLFEPLRANRDALGTSICRDLKRALEDPIGNVDVEEEEKLQKEHKLPSPTKSPKKKKKRGMTAEQAKYARDLCTITHAVLKFLGLVLSLPIHRIFTDQQLTQILGGIIDIPMCPELPTPNGRKTYALAICVIQSLCLPANVLSPVSDSIAYVLGRGIDGELGKEGKKGSASDGFKAIHDLALHNPPVFVPAFRHLLDSILHNILSPSLNLRIQATHALGGLAYASTTLPISQVHKDLSTWVVEYLLASPKRVSPSKKSGSPTPATQESDICRTLRTTLNVEDPVHVTHGPVWALHVLGSFIVLLGSAFRTDVRVCRAISSLLILTLRHKKVSVRKLACVVWRMVVWSWHQYILPSPADGDGGPKRPAASQSQWGLIETVLTWGVGVGTCYAIVGSELGSVELVRLDRIFTLMVNKNEEARNDVLQCIIQLVDFERQQHQQKQEQVDWELDKLLSPSFMSGMGDILAVEFQDLSRSVSIIRTELPDVRDLRGLTREELVELGTMGLFLDQWSSAISMRNGQHNNEDLLLETWDAMLKTVMTLAEAGGEDAEATAMQKLVAALYDSLRTSPEERRSSDSKSDRSSTQEQFDLAKSLRVVRRAWISLSQVGPARQLEDYASQLLARLIEFEDELGEMQVDVREEWAGLCVELVLASADAMDSLSLFWKNVDSTWSWSADVQSVVWTKFVQVWQESRQDNWDAAIVLISAPFCGQNAWNLSDDELSTWERFLTFIVNQGCDNGCDAVTIMDTIARRLQRKCNPTFTCLVRIADMLMSHLETQFMEITALPENVVDFIADSLNQSYPPAPSTGLFASWMMRSLGRLINVCPDALYLDFIDSLQDSLILWITDESSAATECYDDIVTCYENLLLRLVDVHPEAEQYMGRFAPILNAMFNGPSKAVSAYDAFDVFWHTTHTVFEAMDICLWPVKIREYIYGTPAESSSSSAPATSQKESGVREEAEEQEDFDSEITSTEASIGGSSSASALALVPTPGLFSPSRDSRSPDPPLSPALEFPDSPIPDRIQTLAPSVPIILSTPSRPFKGKSRVSLSDVLLSATAATPTTPHPPRPTTPVDSEGRILKSFSFPETPSKSRSTPFSMMKPLPSSSPSNKRRRISNKENESPSASASSSSPRATFSPSRSDRGTLMDSPSHRSLTSRKRPFEDITESSGELVGKGRVLDFSEKERPTKRVRISVPIPSLVLPLAPTQRSASEVVPSPPVSQKESRKERELESESDCTPSSSSLRRTGSVLSRKRKALQIDCVEIKVSPAKVPLRFADVADEREMRTPTRRMSTRNRRKTTKESDTEKKFRTKTESATVASPVRGEDAEGDLDPDFHQAGKYEPIDLHSDSDCGSDAVGPIEQLSSDDDPYLGQVTPGHLISPVPALRRGRRAEEDEDEDEVPSSDDSDSSSSLFGSGGGGGGGRRGESSGQVSPLREVMIRRLQRTASADGSRSVTLGMSAIKTLEQLLNS